MVSETTSLERYAGLRAVSRPSRLALVVALLSVASGCVTYALLTGLTPYSPDHTGLIALLLVNLTLVLTLAGLILWRLARLWATRQSGRAGARLHVRLGGWFSAIAVVPALLGAGVAAGAPELGPGAVVSGPGEDAPGDAGEAGPGYVEGP